MLLCGTMQATNQPSSTGTQTNNTQPPSKDRGDNVDEQAQSENKLTNPTLQKIWDLINRIKAQGSKVNATLVEMSNKIALDNNSKDSSIIIKLDNIMKDLASWTKNVIGIQTQDKASRDFIKEIRDLDRQIQEETRNAEAQLKKNKGAYTNLSQSIQSQQTTIATLVETARGRGEKLIQLDQELTSLQQRLDDADISSKNLQDDINHLNSTMASTNDEIKSKEAVIQSNTDTMRGITADIVRTQKERNQLSEQLKTLRTSLSKFQEEFNKNSNELFAKRTDLGNLARDLLAARTEEANLKRAIEDRRSAITELNARSTPTEIAQQKGALEVIKDSITLLNNTLKEAEQRTGQARAAFNLRASTLNKLIEDNKIAVREANQIEAQIAEIQQGATELSQQKIQQDKAVEKAEETLKKTQEQLRALNVQKATNEATQNSVTQEFNDRRRELDRINKDISNLEGEINQRINEITRSHEGLKSNNSNEVNKYDDAALRFEGSIARINISLKSLGERLNAFKQSIDQIRARNAAAMAQREATTNALRPRSSSEVD
jgi:chromosome segregation ATPase